MDNGEPNFMKDSQKVSVLNKRKYQPFGRCIYCGETSGLSCEHILPLGLSGTAELPEASCERCRKITGEIEQIVLRGPMWAVRVYRRLESRTKHKEAPKTYALTVIRGGRAAVVSLPPEEYPILLPFPVFPPPAFLNPEGYCNGIHVKVITTISFGPRPDEILKKLGADEIRITRDLKPVAFARMLAKIAYAWAAAEGQLDAIDGESLVIPAILGKTDDIGRWVGTLDRPSLSASSGLHELAIHRDTSRRMLIAEVRLFADSQTPSYGYLGQDLSHGLLPTGPILPASCRPSQTLVSFSWPGTLHPDTGRLDPLPENWTTSSEPAGAASRPKANSYSRRTKTPARRDRSVLDRIPSAGRLNSQTSLRAMRIPHAQWLGFGLTGTGRRYVRPRHPNLRGQVEHPGPQPLLSIRRAACRHRGLWVFRPTHRKLYHGKEILRQ